MILDPDINVCLIIRYSLFNFWDWTSNVLVVKVVLSAFTSLVSHPEPTQSQEHIVTARMLLCPPLTTHNAVISEMIQTNVDRSNGVFSKLSFTKRDFIVCMVLGRYLLLLKIIKDWNLNFYAIVGKIKKRNGRGRLAWKRRKKKTALRIAPYFCHLYLSCCMYNT